MRAVDRALVVMAKVPRPGRVKTRMTPPFSEAQAAALYTAFLRDVIAGVDTAALATGAQRVLYVGLGPGDQLGEMQSFLPDGWRLGAQPDGSLGDRLEAARAFADAEQVVIVGSDAPHMKPERLRLAFERLAPKTIVVGPTEDGGYDFIALSRADAGPWDGVPWSTADVLAATRQLVKQQQQTLIELSVSYDLDDIEDLKRLDEQAGLQAQHTWRLLQDLGYGTATR